jgi:hypothetical protein
VIKSQFWEFLINSSYFVYTFKSRCTNWFKVRVLRRHDRYELAGKPYEEQTRIAIIALWPRPAILKSVLRLIDFFIKENVHVICVINKSQFSDDWLVEIEKRNVSILERPNVGRDFGAYRTGFLFAKNNINFQKVTNLIFANDSVFFLHESEPALRKVIDSDKDVTSLYLNYQFHLHAQSFFVNYNSRAFHSKSFVDFWKSYYPSQERKHAINNGEVRLSQLLQKKGFQFQGHYSARQIIDTFIENELDLADLANLYKLHDDPQSLRKKQYLPKSFHELFVIRSADSQNVSHLFGTYLTRTVGAPLKLDILKTGSASTYEIYSALESKIDPSELENLLIFMQTQGTWSSNRGIKSLWISRGLIS